MWNNIFFKIYFNCEIYFKNIILFSGYKNNFIILLNKTNELVIYFFLNYKCKCSTKYSI